MKKYKKKNKKEVELRWEVVVLSLAQSPCMRTSQKRNEMKSVYQKSTTRSIFFFMYRMGQWCNLTQNLMGEVRDKAESINRISNYICPVLLHIWSPGEFRQKL